MLLSPLPNHLSKKLGLRANDLLIAINQPVNYFELLSDLPESVRIVHLNDNLEVDSIHIFVYNQDELLSLILDIKSVLKKSGKLWIFYPKRSSRIRTDLDMDFFENLAHQTLFVINQITDFDLIWTGIEFRME